MSNDTKVLSLNAREAAIMAAIIKHSEGDPIVNWDLAAKDAGYNNIDSAKRMWSRLKKRVKEAAGSDENTNAPVSGIDKTSPTKKTPTKPKKATSDGSTTGKPKRTPKKKVDKAAEDDEEVEEGGGGNGEVKAEPKDDEALG